MVLNAEHFKLWATFKGFQPNELKGGFTDWFVLHSNQDEFGNRHPLHESTVGRSTLIELGVKIPDIPKFVPENFKSVDGWTFSCGTPSCGIRFAFDKARCIEHIKETKHAPIMEHISSEDPKVGHPNVNKAIFLRPRTENDTQPLDEDLPKQEVEFKREVSGKVSTVIKEDVIPTAKEAVQQAEKEAKEDAEQELKETRVEFSPEREVSEFRQRMEKLYPFLKKEEK